MFKYFQVVFGEHTIDQEQDCLKSYCAPKVQVIEVDEVTIHENYKAKAPQQGFDIALVRLKDLALLSFVSKT